MREEVSKLLQPNPPSNDDRLTGINRTDGAAATWGGGRAVGADAGGAADPQPSAGGAGSGGLGDL